MINVKKDKCVRVGHILKNNRADQYIWYLIITLVLFLLAAIFVMAMKFSAGASTIISDVENTSDMVLAQIKKEYYGNYIVSDKKLDISEISVTDDMVSEKLAAALKADKVTGKIIKKVNGRLEWEISSITYTSDTDCIYLNFHFEIPIFVNGNQIYTYKKDLAFASGFNIKNY